MICHCPADDPARGQVDHGGEIGPALPGAHAGDVAGPGGVERQVLRAEIPGQQVECLCLWIGEGGPATPAPTPAGVNHDRKRQREMVENGSSSVVWS